MPEFSSKYRDGYASWIKIFQSWGRKTAITKKIMKIFVVGPPRSGTTLINSLLTGGAIHPMLPECTYFTRIINLYNEIKLYPEQKRFAAYFGSEEFLGEIFQLLIRDLLANTRTKAGGKSDILVLKDPKLTLIMDAIVDLVDEPMKYVFCVRDPRDVVASYCAV